MIGDKININPAYYATAEAILKGLATCPQYQHREKLVVLIGGESGSGKSVAGTCLGELLEDEGLGVLLIHLDDYFKLPPATNHARRVEDINWVGPGEVSLDLLQSHINAFIAGDSHIEKPLMHYDNDVASKEIVSLEGKQVLIIEGTYAFYLHNDHYRIFMSRDYKQTLAQRIARGREQQDPFIEKVLAIEHALVAPGGATANAIVKTDYSVLLT